MTESVERGVTFKSCTEIADASGAAAPTLEADCQAYGEDPNVTATYLPGGCPRGDDMMCGLVTEVTGATSIGFYYVSGDDALDAMLCDTCNTAGIECCIGPMFP